MPYVSTITRLALNTPHAHPHTCLRALVMTHLNVTMDQPIRVQLLDPIADLASDLPNAHQGVGGQPLALEATAARRQGIVTVEA